MRAYLCLPNGIHHHHCDDQPPSYIVQLSQQRGTLPYSRALTQSSPTTINWCHHGGNQHWINNPDSPLPYNTKQVELNKALAYKREILDLGDGDPSLKYECACFSFLGICPIIGKAPKWPFSMCTVHWPEHPKGDCCNFLIRRLQR